ncbi:MAG TPA: hypothetical protein DEB70_11605 [Planctomycetaceae bacterium]|nr:hypothetical protein [Planctomycetaceae bacterium]
MNRTIVAFIFQDEWCISMKFLDDLDDNQLTISHRFHSMPILRTSQAILPGMIHTSPPEKLINTLQETFGKRGSGDRRS